MMKILDSNNTKKLEVDDGSSYRSEEDGKETSPPPTCVITKMTSTVSGVAKEIPSPPDTQSMKELRKQSTFAMGVASGVTGLLVGGPIIGVVAGVAGAVIIKKKLKKRERKAMEDYQTLLAELLCPPFASGSVCFGSYRTSEMFWDAKQN